MPPVAVSPLWANRQLVLTSQGVGPGQGFPMPTSGIQEFSTPGWAEKLDVAGPN